MDRKEAESRLAALVPEVARELGFQLVARDDTHVAEMESPAGWKLFFNPGWQGGYDKLSIASSWPRDDEGRQVEASYDSKIPRINVSISRRADEIAKEIRRRLIPEWEPLWHKAVARIESGRKHENATRQNALALAKIVGVAPSEVDKNGNFSLYRSEAFPESLSDIQVSGENVRLDLRCELAEAKEILSALVRLSRR
jgi:hypothetical protein